LSLLSICTQVAGEIPVAAPTAIVGNSDETAMLLLACAQVEGKTLSRRPDGGWVSTIREYDFTTSATATMSGTVANTGVGGVAQITGLASTAAISAKSWYAFGTGLKNNSIVQNVDSGSQVTLNQPAATTVAGTYQFGQSDYSLPSDFLRLVDNTLWDRSRFWSMRGPQSPQQWQLYKSSVIGRATIQRRFRFRSINGVQSFSIDPVPLDNGSALVFEYVSSSWCQSSGGTPQTSWLADTDTGIVDEYLLQLGIRWRMLRRLGMAYDVEMSEYETQVLKAMANDGGAAILNLTPSDGLTLLSPWNVPETNFGGAISN
jgi:hypothetical protein